MIDSDYVLWIQLVMLRQRSPSILSIQKFVGEPKLEFRMVFQIADCAKTELFCATSQRHERVGIVEPERFGHADAGFAELVRDLLERQFIAAFQNLLRDRSGIFRVSIDLAAAQRLPENDRAAHSLAMLSRNSSLDQAALRDFAEDIRFREFFRADNDRLSSQRTRQKNKESRNEGAGRLFAKIGERTLLDDSAFIHEHDFVSEISGFGEIVGYQKRRLAEAGKNFLQI